MIFRDRSEAGEYLAAKLAAYADRRDVLVLGIPRGGVPVAFEVARRLHAPFGIILVRKLGLPGQEEVGMGAIAAGGVRVLNEEMVNDLGVERDSIEAVTQKELVELNRRNLLYRGNRAAMDMRGRTVILVDDGLATGSTMRAAICAIRAQKPSRIVVAVPVGAKETCAQVASQVDELVCFLMPQSFRSVGEWYDDFSQTTDEQVLELMRSFEKTTPAQLRKSNLTTMPWPPREAIRSTPRSGK